MPVHAEHRGVSSQVKKSEPRVHQGRYDDIVALATSSDPWSPAVITSIALASRWDACLTSCYFEPSLRHLGGIDSEPTALGLLLQPRGEDGGERAAFASHAHRSGVREATWVVAHEGIATSLRGLGSWNDLAILERDMVQGNHLFDILGEAMLGCRIPCLVLPPEWFGEISTELVAICWDGSIESTRALHGALPFLLAAKNVLLINGQPYDQIEDGALRFDPVRYLLCHGITAKQRFIEVSPSLAGEVILREAKDMHATLLVMGAYGHSRLRERVLGGATRYILEHARLPLLMQH